MVILHIAGKSNDRAYVTTEHLADFVACNLPHVSVVKHMVPASEWPALVESVCGEYRFAWDVNVSPIIWTEAGVLIGGSDDFVLDVESKYGMKFADAQVPEDVDALIEENIKVAEQLQEKKNTDVRENQVVEYLNTRATRVELLNEALSQMKTLRHFLTSSVGSESSLIRVIAGFHAANTIFDKWRMIQDQLENPPAVEEEKVDHVDLGLDDENWGSDNDSPPPSPRTPRGEKIVRVKHLKKALLVIVRSIHCDDVRHLNEIQKRLDDFIPILEELQAKSTAEPRIHDLFGEEMKVIEDHNPVLEQYAAQCNDVKELLGHLANIEKIALKPHLRLSLGVLGDEKKKKKKEKKGKPVEWDPIEVMARVNSLTETLIDTSNKFKALLSELVAIKEGFRSMHDQAMQVTENGVPTWICDEARRRIALAVHVQ